MTSRPKYNKHRIERYLGRYRKSDFGVRSNWYMTRSEARRKSVDVCPWENRIWQRYKNSRHRAGDVYHIQFDNVTGAEKVGRRKGKATKRSRREREIEKSTTTVTAQRTGVGRESGRQSLSNSSDLLPRRQLTCPRHARRHAMHGVSCACGGHWRLRPAPRCSGRIWCALEMGEVYSNKLQSILTGESVKRSTKRDLWSLD